MTAPELAKLTLAELRNLYYGPTAADVAGVDVFEDVYRRAQANAQVQAERDEFDEELHTCRAIVGATSEHLHVDLEELVDKLRTTERDARSWQELASTRAARLDAMREAAQALVSECDGLYIYNVVHGATETKGVSRQCLADVEKARKNLAAALAAAPAAQPTPAALPIEITGLPPGTLHYEAVDGVMHVLFEPTAAPVTDAEIEAAIETHADSWNSHGFLQGGKVSAGLIAEKKAIAVDDGKNLRALIARRVASAGAAPVDPWNPSQCDYDRSIHNNPDANAWADLFVQVFPGLADKHDVMRGWFANAMMAMHDSPRCRPAPVGSEREKAIEAAIDRFGTALFRVGEVMGKPEWLSAIATAQEESKEAANQLRALMRSAPPAPAGDQDAKLRELRAWVRSTWKKSVATGKGGWWSNDAKEIAAEIDRLLAAPAASAIAAAPEAGTLRNLRLWVEEQETVGDYDFALRERIARRIEALERAAQEGSK